MTIAEQLIEESAGIEEQIKAAVESGKISKRASQVLCDEMIRMIVQLQTRDLVMRQAQANVVAMPNRDIVRPS